ncbi:ABC transporter, ATP-binding protein [uncultured spirochete]|uniref:ABC transporter, ATP-binding protein n=1 Tax=uncultured spirochete TaxID=156406 RepID=A0A3P3XQC2_9SPIR|nr:ABC transporter, ATP-binding protein [uncultured spirochete]
MITVENVYKAYSNVQAVAGLSFEARQGEIFGLIGPNGAGKSTMIRMIMNILAPDSGTIRFDGEPLSETDKDRIGYLPEERGLYRKAKLGEVLEYLAAIKGAKPADYRPSIDAWLERFGLSEWKLRKVQELSKGMAQKAQFIGAIAHNPSVVLFDEPFSGLDPLAQDELLAVMVELKQKGVTVLFSTHIMEHAEKICERILLINKGKEVVYGTMADIKAQYGRNAVQLEFDGDASFVAGLDFVESVVSYPRWIEVELKDGADADLLFRAIAGRLKVRRFETVAPSLHKIFIRIVGGEEAQNVQA